LNAYESKIKEYESAYSENQALIKELEEQLRALECQEVKEEEEEEIKLPEDFETECLQFENNFTSALQEREEEIAQLKITNDGLREQIQQQEVYIQELLAFDEEKTFKL
jgi:SMC interacting uncharacterized protein involved in chromosome segregation